MDSNRPWLLALGASVGGGTSPSTPRPHGRHCVHPFRRSVPFQQKDVPVVSVVVLSLMNVWFEVTSGRLAMLRRHRASSGLRRLLPTCEVEESSVLLNSQQVR
jgi:hypothetical protein